jgi:hypothetical protein
VGRHPVGQIASYPTGEEFDASWVGSPACAGDPTG